MQQMEVNSLIDKMQKEFDDLPPGAIQPQSIFKEVVYWSSINSIVLATMIEFEYGVILSSDDFKSVNTVNELHSLIKTKATH